MSHPTNDIPTPEWSGESDSVPAQAELELESSSPLAAPDFEVEELTPSGGKPERAAGNGAGAKTKPKAASTPTPASSPAPVAAAAVAEKAPAMVDDDDEVINLVWYVLKVQSSREDTIRDALERRVKIQGLGRYFGRIVVPTEKITEIRNNKKRIVERKTYPGYIMVEMELNEKTWFTVRETPGVGDFVGAHGTPTKMTETEVNQMLGHEIDKAVDAAEGSDRRRTGRPREDQRRAVREFRGERRGGDRGTRARESNADHLQPAHAGGSGILAGGADLIDW